MNSQLAVGMVVAAVLGTGSAAVITNVELISSPAPTSIERASEILVEQSDTVEMAEIPQAEPSTEPATNSSLPVESEPEEAPAVTEQPAPAAPQPAAPVAPTVSQSVPSVDDDDDDDDDDDEDDDDHDDHDDHDDDDEDEDDDDHDDDDD